MSNQRVSAAAVIIDYGESELDYKIGLIQRIGEGDLWGFPAGMVEEGESTEEAVIRELLEETGYEGKVLGLRGIVHWGTNSIGYIYTVKLGRKVTEGEYPFEFVTHTEPHCKRNPASFARIWQWARLCKCLLLFFPVSALCWTLYLSPFFYAK